MLFEFFVGKQFWATFDSASWLVSHQLWLP